LGLRGLHLNVAVAAAWVGCFWRSALRIFRAFYWEKARWDVKHEWFSKDPAAIHAMERHELSPLCQYSC